MIKYQLPHTQLDRISDRSDHQRDTYLYGKLSTKLLQVLVLAAVF